MNPMEIRIIHGPNGYDLSVATWYSNHYGREVTVEASGTQIACVCAQGHVEGEDAGMRLIASLVESGKVENSTLLETNGSAKFFIPDGCWLGDAQLGPLHARV